MSRASGSSDLEECNEVVRRASVMDPTTALAELVSFLRVRKPDDLDDITGSGLAEALKQIMVASPVTRSARLEAWGLTEDPAAGSGFYPTVEGLSKESHLKSVTTFHKLVREKLRALGYNGPGLKET